MSTLAFRRNPMPKNRRQPFRCGVQVMRGNPPERRKIPGIGILNAVKRHPKEGVEIAFNTAGRPDPGRSAAGSLRPLSSRPGSIAGHGPRLSA
jgi:hypothetical protein